MAYRQYTQCVDAAYFNPMNPFAQAALVGLYVTLPTAVIPVLLVIAGGGAGWGCLFLLALIYGIAGVIGYCYWWLYRRLICLPAPPGQPNDKDGSQLAIGLLIDILPPRGITSFPDLDNDYSIGILVQPNPLGSDYDVVSQSTPFGYLVKEQPATHDLGLLFTGQAQADHTYPGHPELEIKSEILHCEFEGRAIYDIYLASRAALLPAVAALFACLIPGAGWVAAILAALAALLMGTGIAVGQFDEGDPTDVNPNVGEFHTNDDSHQGADTLVIAGHWVYDSGHRFDQHSAYNELHPVTFCTKANSDGTGDVILLKKRWGTAIGDATSPATLASQKLPQNQWEVHPMIDGCTPPVVIP